MQLLLLFVIVMTLALLLERVFNALCFAFLYAVVGRTSVTEQGKGVVSVQVATGLVACCVNFASSAATLGAQVLSVACQWMMTGALTLAATCLLYIVVFSMPPTSCLN